jgi:formyltetrahydrofolate synthetase
LLAGAFGGQLALLGRDALACSRQLLLQSLQPAQGIAGDAAGGGGGQLRRQARIGPQELDRRRGGR